MEAAEWVGEVRGEEEAEAEREWWKLCCDAAAMEGADVADSVAIMEEKRRTGNGNHTFRKEGRSRGWGGGREGGRGGKEGRATVERRV